MTNDNIPQWIKDEELTTEKGKKFFPSWTKIRLKAVVLNEVFDIDRIIELKEMGYSVKEQKADIPEDVENALEAIIENHIKFRKLNFWNTEFLINGFSLMAVTEKYGIKVGKNKAIIFCKNWR